MAVFANQGLAKATAAKLEGKDGGCELCYPCVYSAVAWISKACPRRVLDQLARSLAEASARAREPSEAGQKHPRPKRKKAEKANFGSFLMS